MKNSKIGWTHHTWNPWWGCNKVSAACLNCYIDSIMRRSGNEPFHGPKQTKTSKDPMRWNRKAKKDGVRRRVFTCSMSDFFHPGADKWRPEAWEIIRQCGQLDWLILTKRPELIADRLPGDWGNGYPNVWLGTTIEDQSQLLRLEHLVKIPAAIRFVSAEPLLGPVRFGRLIRKVDWVITGCEKAGKQKRRELNLDWVRSIRDECDKASVALFHKQYYAGTKIVYDGRIDGEVRQSWPCSGRSGEAA
jgi:protein gp37